jgi:hypothetical protein
MFLVIVHAGAGSHHEQSHAKLKTLMHDACIKAAREKSAIDAVTVAVRILEESPLTNAGLGSSLNRDGFVEADACCVDGISGVSGAVGAARGLCSPIEVATSILTRRLGGLGPLGLVPPALLTGDGAHAWATAQGLHVAPLSHDAHHVTTTSRRRWQDYTARLRLAQATNASISLPLTAPLLESHPNPSPTENPRPRPNPNILSTPNNPTQSNRADPPQPSSQLLLLPLLRPTAPSHMADTNSRNNDNNNNINNANNNSNNSDNGHSSTDPVLGRSKKRPASDVFSDSLFSHSPSTACPLSEANSDFSRQPVSESKFSRQLETSNDTLKHKNKFVNRSLILNGSQSPISPDRRGGLSDSSDRGQGINISLHTSLRFQEGYRLAHA